MAKKNILVDFDDDNGVCDVITPGFSVLSITLHPSVFDILKSAMQDIKPGTSEDFIECYCAGDERSYFKIPITQQKIVFQES